MKTAHLIDKVIAFKRVFLVEIMRHVVQFSLAELLVVNDAEEVPHGRGEMVLVRHTHDPLDDVPQSGINIPRERHPFLPVPVAVFMSAELVPFCQPHPAKWGHQVEATFSSGRFSDSLSIAIRHAGAAVVDKGGVFHKAPPPTKRRRPYGEGCARHRSPPDTGPGVSRCWSA